MLINVFNLLKYLYLVENKHGKSSQELTLRENLEVSFQVSSNTKLSQMLWYLVIPV
jgi:hypothetical protein